MRKVIYYLAVMLLLVIISLLPVSAKENKTCVRTENNLHVRDEFILSNNLRDILTTPCVDEVEKVYDFADLLTDEEEDKLYQEVIDYINLTNYDLALVTTNENLKSSPMAYADDFYDYNKFGITSTRDGLIILIDMQNRELYISTTGYAIKMYSDERLGIREEFYGTNSVLDNGYDYIKQEDYYNTFSSMIKRLIDYYQLGFPDTNANLEIDENGHPHYIKKMPYSMIFIISTIITTIVALVTYFKSRLKIKVGSIISYMKDKQIKVKEDQLVNTIVTHHLRASDSSSGGGSSGGGSSFHSSSSGSSHGGGGRSF